MNKPNGTRSKAKSAAKGTETNPVFAAWPELLTAGMQINAEVANFVSHRISEDMALPSRIASSRNAEDISQTYTEFFQTASQDYANEMQKLTELVSEVAPLTPPGFPLFGLPSILAAKTD
ncbi:MAG: phasin family protein [Burkholderiaceae bacterium]